MVRPMFVLVQQFLAQESIRMNYEKELSEINNLLNSGQIDLAEDNLNQLISKNPDDFSLENYYGVFLLFNKKPEEAIKKFKKSISIKRDFFDSHYNLAECFVYLEKYSEALSELILCKEIQPKNSLVFFNLGTIYYIIKNYEKAEFYFKISLELDNNNNHFKNALGRVLIELKKYDQAITLFNDVLKLEKDNIASYFNLALTYHLKKNYITAIFFYEQLLNLDKKIENAYINLSICYNKIKKYSSALKISARGLEVFKSPLLKMAHGKNLFNFGNIDEGTILLKDAMNSSNLNSADKLEAAQSLLFRSNYCDNSLINNDYLHLASEFEKIYSKHNNVLEYNFNLIKNNKIKIGFVSADLREHAVGYQILNVLRELYSLNNFILYAYYNNEEEDIITREFKKNFHYWRNIFSIKTDIEIVNQIRKDEITILVDLSGYTTGNKIGVFIHRGAPIQISWCGYLNTTGLKNMDYVIADTNVLLKKEQSFYTEKIISLPNIWTNLSDFGYLKDIYISKQVPLIRNKYITFGSFNNIRKLNHKVISLWSKILKKIFNSKIILQSPEFSDEELRQIFLNLFLKEGVLSKQITFLGFLDRKSLLEKYNDIDIALDPFPYNGGTTSLEASWMCVPILAKRGNTFLSRCGESININLGLKDWIFNDEAECIDKAIKFSSDRSYLQSIKDYLIKIKYKNNLFNSKLFAQNISEVFTKLVRGYN